MITDPVTDTIKF